MYNLSVELRVCLMDVFFVVVRRCIFVVWKGGLALGWMDGWGVGFGGGNDLGDGWVA